MAASVLEKFRRTSTATVHRKRRSAPNCYQYQLYLQFRPISAMSRIVCLIAQMIESMNSLNCGGGNSSNAGKHEASMARIILKKPTRCSGYSAKSWLIMFKVGSNTASRMGRIWGVKSVCKRRPLA